MDIRARWVKISLYLHGLGKGGLKEAEDEAAGLRTKREYGKTPLGLS